MYEVVISSAISICHREKGPRAVHDQWKKFFDSHPSLQGKDNKSDLKPSYRSHFVFSRGDIDIADPSCLRNACNIWT